MKCSKVQEWISLEIDDQLPPEHVRPLQDHLQACDECRAFREDLQIGLRMLHATDPELPDNFDWKLQLRLSQTLRETARDTAYPWLEEPSAWRRWIARASLSAALGLAAVLSLAVMSPAQLALFSGGGGDTVVSADQPLRLPLQTTAPTGDFAGSTRRPLERGNTFDPFGTSGSLQRNVSYGDRLGMDGLWGDASQHELTRVRSLEQELQSLRRRMHAKDRRIELLEATLDSLTGRTVDTD